MINLVESYGMENCENQIFINQSEQEALFFWLVATLTSVNKTAITFTFDHFSHHLLQSSSHCRTIQKENKVSAVLKNQWKVWITGLFCFLSSSAFGGLVPLDFWWNFDWRWRPTFLFDLLLWLYFYYLWVFKMPQPAILCSLFQVGHPWSSVASSSMYVGPEYSRVWWPHPQFLSKFKYFQFCNSGHWLISQTNLRMDGPCDGRTSDKP